MKESTLIHNPNQFLPLSLRKLIEEVCKWGPHWFQLPFYEKLKFKVYVAGSFASHTMIRHDPYIKEHLQIHSQLETNLSSTFYNDIDLFYIPVEKIIKKKRRTPVFPIMIQRYDWSLSKMDKYKELPMKKIVSCKYSKLNDFFYANQKLLNDLPSCCAMRLSNIRINFILMNRYISLPDLLKTFDVNCVCAGYEIGTKPKVFHQFIDKNLDEGYFPHCIHRCCLDSMQKFIETAIIEPNIVVTNNARLLLRILKKSSQLSLNYICPDPLLFMKRPSKVLSLQYVQTRLRYMPLIFHQNFQVVLIEDKKSKKSNSRNDKDTSVTEDKKSSSSNDKDTSMYDDYYDGLPDEEEKCTIECFHSTELSLPFHSTCSSSQFNSNLLLNTFKFHYDINALAQDHFGHTALDYLLVNSRASVDDVNDYILFLMHLKDLFDEEPP
ncbi:predicted protein [Chaetoceros tenuissimus]|uniref:Uncharacterized protein n=1 Tax=Chaetoceros tenuissimus TaxID=426638 RepID=A0AAD3CSX8_9STRA|nr:predicted protein [Chaetoceros tenuissimus]